MAQIEVPDELLLSLYGTWTREFVDRVNAALGDIRSEINNRFTILEARMSELTGAVSEQTTAVNELSTRIANLDTGPLQGQVDELTRVVAERQAAIDALEADEVLDNEREADYAQRVATLSESIAATTQDVVTNVEQIRANTTVLQGLAPAAPVDGGGEPTP